MAADRPRLAVVDYGIGNLRSAEKALQRVGADAALTDDADRIRAADGVVLPGVGNFGRCMEALRATGLDAPATDAIASGTPFLGICVGMQMLYEGSDESPGTAGLGVVPGRVELLPDTVKRPQMQWNVLGRRRPDPLLDELPEPTWMYFVHSYAAPVGEHTVATVDYGGEVSALVRAGRTWAVQFHPEKSSEAGLALLGAFVDVCREAG